MPVNSISPGKWGSVTWAAMHWVAAGFPLNPTEVDHANYRRWFTTMMHVLPCAECQQHSIKLLESTPPVTDSRTALFKWTVDFHNLLNEQVGAPTVPLQTMQQRYGLMEAPQAAPAPQARQTTPTPHGAPAAQAPQARRGMPPRVNRAPARTVFTAGNQRMMGFTHPEQQRIFNQPRKAPLPGATPATRAPSTRAPGAKAPATRRGCNCGGRR